MIKSAKAEEQEIEGAEEMEESLIKSDNRNMPEIEAYSSSMSVKIQNEEEYQAFIDCLEEYREYDTLWLDLAETDTVVYLDEILAYKNFTFLTIKNGGTISARNMENLNASPVRGISLYHSYAIREC